jgi:hypothetical protein
MRQERRYQTIISKIQYGEETKYKFKLSETRAYSIESDRNIKKGFIDKTQKSGGGSCLKSNI